VVSRTKEEPSSVVDGFIVILERGINTSSNVCFNLSACDLLGLFLGPSGVLCLDVGNL
jgi:hypothetical protein